MQHQPKACTSSLGDSSHVTCTLLVVVTVIIDRCTAVYGLCSVMLVYTAVTVVLLWLQMWT